MGSDSDAKNAEETNKVIDLSEKDLSKYISVRVRIIKNTDYN